MANAIHYELLTGGVEQWNAWRSANYRIQPDLSQSDLKGLDLQDANFFDGTCRVPISPAQICSVVI